MSARLASRLAGLLAVAALVLGGPACSRRRPEPTGPGPGSLPPEIAAVWPPSRSAVVVVGEPYEVWAEFTRPLDPATVDSFHVFFMIDTRRLPIDVRWEDSTRRIRIRPLVPLAVLQAYTVELSSALCSAGGVPLGRTFVWQFRTSSLRAPIPTFPGDGALNVSPFTGIYWISRPGDPPVSAYEIFLGRDSAAVRGRRVPVFYRGPAQMYLPVTPWPQDGAPVYWALNAYNAEWGDELKSPLWTFTPLDPATARVDSMKLFLGSSGWSANDDWGRCDDAQILCGPGANAALTWNFQSISIVYRRTIRLAGVRMLVAAPVGGEGALDSSAVTLWATTSSWVCDGIRLHGPPTALEAPGPLASGRHLSPGWISFSSDTLTAHVEAALRWGAVSGYAIRSDRECRLLPPTTLVTARRPVLTLYWWR